MCAPVQFGVYGSVESCVCMLKVCLCREEMERKCWLVYYMGDVEELHCESYVFCGDVALLVLAAL